MRYKTLLISAVLIGTGLLIGLGIYLTAAAQSNDIEHDYVAFDVSPDGENIVLSAADADLYLFNLKTQHVQALTKSTALETNPAFSPDGLSVAYSSRVIKDGGAGICVRSLDGTKRQALTDGRTAFDTMPSFSSDGQQITFVRSARQRPYSMGGWIWDNCDVYIINRDGSGLRRITQHHYYEASHPHFFGADKQVVFAATGDYPDTVFYLFSAPTSGLHPPAKWMPPANSPGNSSLSGRGAWGTDPNINSNGSQAVFVSDRAQGYQYDLWVTRINNGKPRALGMTDISGYNQQPVFTQNGDHIFFLAGTEQNSSSRPIFSLWEVGQDGSQAHRIAGSGLFTNPRQWKPNP